MLRKPGGYCALAALALNVIVCITSSRAQSSGPPCGCAQWPMLQLGDAILYYAEFYESTCDDNPQPCYVYGDYDWPQFCPDCVSATELAESTRQYRGLDAPIAENYVHQLPAGPSRDYSKVIDMPDLQFIQFKGSDGNLIAAKVFVFKIYKQRLLASSTKDEGRMIAIAMQLDRAPSVLPASVECAPLGNPQTCCAYSTIYDRGLGQRLPILVLTARH